MKAQTKQMVVRIILTILMLLIMLPVTNWITHLELVTDGGIILIMSIQVIVAIITSNVLVNSWSEPLKTEKEVQLISAMQQLTGYQHCKQGYSVENLVFAMGLEEEEWEEIKEQCPWIQEDLVHDIDEHFRKQDR